MDRKYTAMENQSTDYKIVNVTSIDRCTYEIISSKQVLKNDDTDGKVSRSVMAPIGPFTVWSLKIRESENAEVDLDKMNAAYMKFYGRNFVSFKQLELLMRLALIQSIFFYLYYCYYEDVEISFDVKSFF